MLLTRNTPHAALELDWDPATAGDLGGPALDEVERALVAQVGAAEPWTPDAQTRAAAEGFEAQHVIAAPAA